MCVRLIISYGFTSMQASQPMRLRPRQARDRSKEGMGYCWTMGQRKHLQAQTEHEHTSARLLDTTLTEWLPSSSSLTVQGSSSSFAELWTPAEAGDRLAIDAVDIPIGDVSVGRPFKGTSAGSVQRSGSREPACQTD